MLPLWTPPYAIPPAIHHNGFPELDYFIVFALVLIFGLGFFITGWIIRSNVKKDLPEPIILPWRYPDAFDKITSTIRISHSRTYGNGWHITHANPDEGTIQAKSRFLIDVPGNRHQEGQILVDLSLAPIEPNATLVHYRFSVISRHGRGSANDVIDDLSERFSALGNLDGN